MTHKDILWDKFDELVEESKEVSKDFNEINQLDDEESKLIGQLNEVREKRKSLASKYTPEYSSKPSQKQFDYYGVLTVVGRSDTYQGDIIRANEDIITISFSYNYGQYTKEIEVPIKELREKGYYKTSWDAYNDSPLYVIDNIKDPLVIFEMIKIRMQREVSELKQELKWGEEDVEKGTKRAKEAKAKLNEYRQVSDSKIEREFNDISFGITDLKIGDILEALPRKICLYDDISK